MTGDQVLLVEDNRFDEILTLRLLRKSEFSDVVIVRDGEQALEYLLGTGEFRGRDPSVLPRFILLDLKMPKVDGIELLRLIREREGLREVPVIVITSSIEERDLKLCTELKVLAYLNKPLAREDLERVLREYGIR